MAPFEQLYRPLNGAAYCRCDHQCSRDLLLTMLRPQERAAPLRYLPVVSGETRVRWFRRVWQKRYRAKLSPYEECLLSPGCWEFAVRRVLGHCPVASTCKGGPHQWSPNYRRNNLVHALLLWQTPAICTVFAHSEHHYIWHSPISDSRWRCSRARHTRPCPTFRHKSGNYLWTIVLSVIRWYSCDSDDIKIR